MARAARTLSAFAWPVAVLALPLVLLLSSLLTFRELREMQGLYLRSRAATIAGRLETFPPESFAQGLEALREEEPALADIEVFDAGQQSPETPVLEPIWRGEQLFITQALNQDGEEIFRAYIPFHSGSRLRIARIDLAASAAEYLVSPARQNVIVASVSGLVLVLLSLSVIWSGRRTARLERRQLELEHLAHLGTMSAVLAHEIRNPLATIKGFAQLAREKADPATAPLFEPVLDEIRRLERLVADLLLYGRPPEPALRWIGWEEIAADLERHAREAIGGRPIRFASEPGEWRIRTDPDLLKAALLNLVRNAVEALGDRPGEVRLAAVAGAKGRLALSVEDDGPGLSEEARARLFEPFFTTKAFGTGLGLSITRKLVASLGGELKIAAVEPHGTRAEAIFARAEVERCAPQKESAWREFS